MKRMTSSNLLKIADQFALLGEPIRAEKIRNGNINYTYKITCVDGSAEHHYILQRINTAVFKDPVKLMENVQKVTEHLEKKLSRDVISRSELRSLHFVPSKSGDLIYVDSDGGDWRVCSYVEDARTYDEITNKQLFYEAGRGFGEFQRLLNDFPGNLLHETIQGFHDTGARYRKFLEDVDRDAAGRVSTVKREIEEIKKRQDIVSVISDKLLSGEIPTRVTHNDTKLNNVMIDDKSMRAVCVIDLDTVMPSSTLYDFGDAIRYGASTAREDEANLSFISLNMELFELFTRGFLEECHQILTDREISLLPISVIIMTLELAIRFLQDYINGDVYFKTDYSGHNLVRARAQLKLLSEIENSKSAMEECVRKVILECRAK